MKRKNGIDYFRIILAIMIIIIHMLSKEYGGILSNVSANTLQYFACWGLMAACYVGVNCFALLSGYLSFGKRHSAKKAIKFYLQLLFYSIVISIFFIVFFKEKITANLLLETLSPLNSKSWWYINVYLGLTFLMPYLDKIITNCDYLEFKRMFKSFFILFCVSNTLFFQNDVFFLNNGFSIFWIVILYLIGAGINKFKINEIYSIKKSIFLYVIFTLLTLVSRILIDNVSRMILGKNVGSGLLYSYLSPTILLSSVFLLLFFINLETKRKFFNKLAATIAGSSLVSYIIHVHPLFLKYIIKDNFIFLSNKSWYIQLALIILIAFFIFVICILMDLIRQFLKIQIIKFFGKLTAIFKRINYEVKE